MDFLKPVVNNDLLKFNKIPFILTILFVIITIIIVVILTYKELKKEGNKK